jgi:hypothetical protein
VFAFNEPEISDDLELTREQRAAIRQVVRDLFARPSRTSEREPGREKGRGSATEASASARTAEMDKIDKAVAKAVEVLNPEQARRWRELTGPPFADVADLRHWGRKGSGKPPGPPPRLTN